MGTWSKKGLVRLVLLCYILSGCKSDHKDPVTITVIHALGGTESDHVAMRDIYESFQDENPDIKLQLISMPSKDKLLRKVEDMIMVGNTPDVVTFSGVGQNDTYDFMIKNDMVLDLMPYLVANSGFGDNILETNLKYWIKSKNGKKKKKKNNNVLEFYKGYYQAESERAAAQVMRDIYDEFAKQHAEGNVTFKPIAVENRDDIVSAQVAGGSFPDMVDVGGGGVPQAAISQNLVYDLKPYIDENNLQDAVGLNYTQHDQDGHIYSVHDQIESRGLWYNASIFEKAGITKDALKDWTAFEEAMKKIRDLNDGSYGYIAGQGSSYIVNVIMASTDNGKKMLESALTEETIYSDEFAEAFKTTAKLDQANGSEHTTDNNGNLMADFNTNGTVGVLFNGVWNASGINADLTDSIEPSLFPGNIAISSAGGGHALAEKSGDATIQKLAEACSQVKNADTVVIDMNYTWGADVDKSIINALMECAVTSTDIDVRFEQLQKELLALIG